MIEIAYLRENSKIKAMPKEVQETILGILQILDIKYGANRNKYEDNGGYIVAVEKKEDFKEIKNKAFVECDVVIPEYVDKIVCSNGQVYTNSLILCNNDFAISLIIPNEDKKRLKKNHLIQRRNYLDSIAYKGKVMICNIEDENYYRYGRKMREVHVKKAHRYKVFCEVHDKKLFDSIENGKEFNINNKEQCFQFALRAFTFNYSSNCMKNNFSSGNKYIDGVAELSLNKSNKVFERFKQCYVEDEWSEIETYR